MLYREKVVVYCEINIEYAYKFECDQPHGLVVRLSDY